MDVNKDGRYFADIDVGKSEKSQLKGIQKGSWLGSLFGTSISYTPAESGKTIYLSKGSVLDFIKRNTEIRTFSLPIFSDPLSNWSMVEPPKQLTNVEINKFLTHIFNRTVTTQIPEASSSPLTSTKKIYRDAHLVTETETSQLNNEVTTKTIKYDSNNKLESTTLESCKYQGDFISKDLTVHRFF